jgi:hypothetical protein
VKSLDVSALTRDAKSVAADFDINPLIDERLNSDGKVAGVRNAARAIR